MVRSAAPGAQSASTLRQLACEIFVLGFPLLLVDAIRRAHPLAPDGFHRFPGGAQQLIPGLFTEDPDCLHTSAAVDLAVAASVLHLPNTHGRYLSVTLFDSAGEAFASLGSHSGDVLDSDILVAAPGWHGEGADGLRALRAPCEVIWAVSRIVARSAADASKAEALAARQYFTPAGATAEAAAHGRAIRRDLAPLELISVRQITDVPPRHLFHRLMQLIQRAPPGVQAELGTEVRARLALLGPGALDAEEATGDDAMLRGFADGWRSIRACREELSAAAIGEWRVLGRLSQASSAPVSRAARALDRLGAPGQFDVLSLRCGADAEGRPLSGAEQYRIRLSPAASPPAMAAWRLSAHDPQDPGCGAVIGDHSPLALEPDGAIELLIRAAPPRRRNANWLRAPPGRFELTLRLYEPSPPALSGAWRMPPIERLPAGHVTARAHRVQPRGRVP